MGENKSKSNSGKSKVLKILIIIIGIVIFSLLVLFVAGNLLGGRESVENDGVVVEGEGAGAGVVNKGVDSGESALEVVSDGDLGGEAGVSDGEAEKGFGEITNNSSHEDDGYVRYINNFLGVEVGYPADWYINENNEEVINTLKGLGYTCVDITVDVLEELCFVIFEVKDKLDTEISVRIASVIGVGSNKYNRDDVREIVRGKEDLALRRAWKDTDREVMRYITSCNKQSIAEYELVEYYDSVIRECNDVNYILNEYAYKTKFDEFSVVQAAILTGVNMVIFEAVSRVGEGDVDKVKEIEGLLSRFKIL